MKKKEECEHKTVEAFWDEDSGDDTITCEDCGKVWYHESYQQILIKEGR